MPLLASILESARIQALLGGLIKITSIELRIGRDGHVDPTLFSAAMRERFHGDLLENCQVIVEEIDGTEVELKSIVGIPVGTTDKN